MNTNIYFISALASMALLSGCSDNELASVETSQKTPIGFHTVGSQMSSRAEIITPSNLKDKDFNVYAFTSNEDGSDGTLFMGNNDDAQGYNGINISYKGGKWDYTTTGELYYWPNETLLNFYAVSPATTHLFSWQISASKKEIHYVCYDEYGAEGNPSYVDVMYAIAPKQTQKTNSGIVKLQFRHITSQVVFKAKKQLSNMNVEIESIVLHNLKNSAIFTIPTTDKAPAQEDWTYNNNLYTSNGHTVIKGASINVGTTETDISIDKPMLLIPQTLTKWNTSHNTTEANTKGESYLEINCKIFQNGAYLHGSATDYAKLYVPFSASWEPGKRYVYTLIFGGGYTDQGVPVLSPINFEAEVSNWAEDINNTTNGNDVIIQ